MATEIKPKWWMLSPASLPLSPKQRRVMIKHPKNCNCLYCIACFLDLLGSAVVGRIQPGSPLPLHSLQFLLITVLQHTHTTGLNCTELFLRTRRDGQGGRGPCHWSKQGPLRETEQNATSSKVHAPFLHPKATPPGMILVVQNSNL